MIANIVSWIIAWAIVGGIILLVRRVIQDRRDLQAKHLAELRERDRLSYQRIKYIGQLRIVLREAGVCIEQLHTGVSDQDELDPEEILKHIKDLSEARNLNGEPIKKGSHVTLY